MKKLFVFFLLIFTSISFAQVESFESDYVDMLKKDIQEESTQIVADKARFLKEKFLIYWYEICLQSFVNEFPSIWALWLNFN